MKKVMFALIAIIIVSSFSSTVNAITPTPKKHKPLVVTYPSATTETSKDKKTVWIYSPITTTEMSKDGMRIGHGMFTKELVEAPKAKRHGGNYSPTKHSETVGYFICEVSFAPPRGVAPRIGGEFLITPATKKEHRLYLGIETNIVWNYLNVFTHAKTWDTLIPKNRVFMEFSSKMGLEKIQFIPLYLKFSPNPGITPTWENPEPENQAGEAGIQLERIGFGFSIQLPKILPTIFDRGSFSILYGKSFYFPEGEKHYTGNSQFAGATIHMAKDLNWGSFETTSSGGIDFKNKSAYFDASLRALVNVLYHGKGWYTQIGLGYDANDQQKNAFMITLRLVGKGKNKD